MSKSFDDRDALDSVVMNKIRWDLCTITVWRNVSSARVRSPGKRFDVATTKAIC